MRPDLQYIKYKFDYYNKLCFDGKLPVPPLRLNTRRGALGLTRHYDKSIEISVRLDLPEEEYIDTLVHEMIHYYILVNNIEDDGAHGTVFRSIMQEISNKYGIKITIEFDPSEEEQIKRLTHTRIVCISELEDGQTGLTVVARNKIFEVWEGMLTLPEVINTTWYVSNRAIFEGFPVALSPRYVIVESEKISHYLTGAKQLVNDGKRISVKND